MDSRFRGNDWERLIFEIAARCWDNMVLGGSMALNSLVSAVLALALVGHAFSAPARNEEFTFKIPPQKISMNIQNQPLTIAASGVISVRSRGRDEYTLRLELDADLSDVQQNITGLLRSQLDKDDPCGDRVAIEHATLTPVGPAGQAVVQLHYERYACARAFGKKMSTKLVGGNGVIQMKFTPTIEGGKTLRLVPEVESIQADGSLGELLRSSPVGAMVTEKLTKALLAAMEKGTDRSLTLPPSVQDIAMVVKAQFEDEGSGRLGIVLRGEAAISPQQILLLKNQLKQRLPVH
jgi:hypothetical protein